MKKSMKKLVSVALAATMVLGLAGCNDGSSQTAATTAPAAEAAGTEAAGAESGADGAQDKAEAANAGLNANILFATHEVGTSNYNLSAELAKPLCCVLPGFGQIDGRDAAGCFQQIE